MYKLESGRLRITVEDPETVKRLTTRFDPTCFITEIILDDCVYFAASEPRNLKDPTSGGRGLNCEYLFDASKEVNAGEYFPKLGVGLLKKEEGDQKFYHAKKYVCIPFENQILEKTENSISFITFPKQCCGYAVESRRKVSVADNRIIMESSMRNVGGRKIITEEYCHNFLSVDGMATDEKYILKMPQSRNAEDRIKERSPGKDFFTAGDGKISLNKHNQIPISFELRKDDIAPDVPFVWEITHAECSAGMEERAFFVPERVNIWGSDHMLCPEVMKTIILEPEEETSWKREWVFNQSERVK